MGLLLAANRVAAADQRPRAAGPRERCPVCGMFVSRAANWVGSLTFRGGETLLFDGPKDLFRCRFGLSEYARGKKTEEIEALFVTEDHSLKPVRAQDAFFVVGSDLRGPMGAEFVPVLGRAQAESFSRDHKTKKVLSCAEITPEIVGALE